MKEGEEKFRILVVDDEATNLQVVGAVLRDQSQYSISLAMNGEDALRQAKAFPPDLILLDVMMSGISGYDVCRALKRDQELQSIPVIFLTAKATVEDFVEGFEAGGTDYISKPFAAEILLARISTHLQLFLKQRELQQFNKEREEMRRSERHAAYQNGLTEMAGTVLHTIGNALTATDMHLYQLKELEEGISKVSAALMQAHQFKGVEEKCEHVSKLIEHSAHWMNGTAVEQFSNASTQLTKNVEYIKDVINAQRSLTQNVLISTEFTVRSLLEDVAVLIKAECETRKITFVIEDSEAISVVDLPRSPLGQMVLQLIQNSFEAIERNVLQGQMEHGQGRVTVRIDQPEQGFWQLMVIDNGEGIEPELLQKVYLPGVTAKEGNAGLGLHNAYNFMNSVGGTLSVMSDGKQSGATVTAQFPC